MKETVYIFKTEDYTVTAKTDKPDSAWKSFRNRVEVTDEERLQQRASHYCAYSSQDKGELKLWDMTEGCLGENIDERERKSCQPVFFENKRYHFTIRFHNVSNSPKHQPRICHVNTDVEDSFDYDHDAHSLHGQLSFMNEPGLFRLSFSYTTKQGRERTAWLTWNVVSPKLDTEDDYKTILREVNREFGRVVFKYVTTTYQQLTRGRLNSDEIWLQLFKQVVGDYLQGLRIIVQSPHLKLERTVTTDYADRVKRWNVRMENEYEERRLERTHDVRRFSHEETISTIDTKENRFVKHTLLTISRKLKQVFAAILANNKMSASDIASIEEYEERLKKIERNAIWRNIGRYDGRSNSMVLQQRQGYRQVSKAWLTLQRGIDLYHGASAIGTRPIWEIYELWCYLKMKQLIAETLGIACLDENGELQYRQDAELYMHETNRSNPATGDVSMLVRDVEFLYPKSDDETDEEAMAQWEEKRDDVIKLHYQYEFRLPKEIRNGESGGNADTKAWSATVDQKPDILLDIEKKGRITLTYLFDAKYRVNDGDYFSGEAKAGDELPADFPPRDAINQMHQYRDAIYYGREEKDRPKSKEVIGGYILFPGRGSVDSIRAAEYYKSIERVNIGAYPLLPTTDKAEARHSDQLLKDYLNKILIERPTIEHIQTAIPQRGLQYKDNIDGRNVFVGTVKTDAPDRDALLAGTATEYHTGESIKSDINIMQIRYFTPSFGKKIHGYYEVTNIKPAKKEWGKPHDSFRLYFTLGKYTPVKGIELKNAADDWYGKMISLEELEPPKI